MKMNLEWLKQMLLELLEPVILMGRLATMMVKGSSSGLGYS